MCLLDPPEPTKSNRSKKDAVLIIAGAFFLIVGVACSIVIPLSEKGSSSSSSPIQLSTDPEDYVWSKTGLEQIPWANWKEFTEQDKKLEMEAQSFYIKGFPFPGDVFTSGHYDAWKDIVAESSLEDLLDLGYIMQSKDSMKAAKVLDDYKKVPTLFSDPIILEESAIDYRLQFAKDIGSQMIGESAAKGRLVNPAGRRLREHFYRFPDQCDATPIALEVFLRLMIYDQIEAFFHTEKIGLWHDLFPEIIERSFYDSEELSVARWYGERFAESYVHKISNGWVYPLGPVQNIDTYMMAVGLDPYDETDDVTTPAGLGNVVGKRVTEWLSDNDGLQRAMDFVDIEGLERIDQFHSTQDWYHWKPTYAGSDRFQGIRNGIVTKQTFVSPSLGIFSFLYENEADYIAQNLESAVPVLDTSEEAYIAKAQQFLNIRSSIGDHEKAVAELSNNKISGSVFLILAYVPMLKNLTAVEEFPQLYDEFSMVTSGCAEYAATHAAWRHKRTYFAGRPKTIIRHLAATNAEFATANPNAKDFEPMIPDGDHPEYPSGSSTIYTAFAQAADNWFLENFGLEDASKKTGKLTFTVPASKFYWQDGPSQDVTLEYENLNKWIEELPLSRVYGGVHFLDSGEAGLALGKEVGNSCSNLLKRLKEGDMTATYTSPTRQPINAFHTTTGVN